jgi:hypothetical protein
MQAIYASAARRKEGTEKLRANDVSDLDPELLALAEQVIGAQPEAPAEPSGWQLNAVTHVAAWLGDLQDVPRDASYWTNGRFVADCMDAHDVLLAAPAAMSGMQTGCVPVFQGHVRQGTGRSGGRLLQPQHGDGAEFRDAPESEAMMAEQHTPTRVPVRQRYARTAHTAEALLKTIPPETMASWLAAEIKANIDLVAEIRAGWERNRSRKQEIRRMQARIDELNRVVSAFEQYDNTGGGKP